MNKLRFNPLLIALYMLPALVWWAYLLWKNYQNLYQKEVKILQITSKVKSHEELIALPKYLELTEQYHRNCNMVIGEGSVFFLFLLGGLWYVYRAFQKERELSRRQQNFQLSISHELKTPVTSMQLVFDTIKQRAQKLTPEQLVTMATTGKRESVRLFSLVNDILLSGQLESKWKPHEKPLDMSKLVDDCVQSVAAMHPNTEFEVQISKEASSLYADEQGIQHILLNLIENAAKYSPLKAKVTIACERGKANYKITVRDTGVGISPKERKKIFHKFYRIGNENTRETRGTGLGLYVVKQIVDAHQGKISVSENEPIGTVFTIILPQNEN